MRLCDVNVLIYAHREDASPQHEAYREWLEKEVNGGEPLGLSELVLSGFLRVVTQPKFLSQPTPLGVALDFVDQLARHPNTRFVRPGPMHFNIFLELCRTIGAHGKLVADAYHAALALEHACEWITADRDFARFPGLRWRHPLDPTLPP